MDIIYDVVTHNFKYVGFDDLDFKDQNIHIGFTSNGSLPVEFSDLSFSIEVSLGDENILSDIFPPEGFQVLSTDQEEVHQYHVCDLVPEKEYLVKFKVKNNHHEESFSKTFSISATKALYPSWIWSEEEGDWVPPTPEPTDGEYYWEESLGQWTPVEQMIKRLLGDEEY